MDLTVPDHLPELIKIQLLELINEYEEELITFKGYNSKREKLLQNCNAYFEGPHTPKQLNLNHHPSILSFDPIAVDTSKRQSLISPNGSINTSSLSSGMNKRIIERMKSTYYTDIDSNVGGLKTQNSTVSLPLNQSSIVKFGYQPTNPLLPRVANPTDTKKATLPNSSLSSILSKRAEQQGKELAMISVNSKGREKAITWNKLFGKVNKLSNDLDKLVYTLKKKSVSKGKSANKFGEVSHMSKVLLWYSPDDLVDFASALFACFNSDLVPIPVNLNTYDLSEIEQMVKMCDIQIVLISNDCYQELENMTDKLEHSKEVYRNFAKIDLSQMHDHHQSTGIKLLKTDPWSSLKFFKTTDLGTSSKSKKVYQVPGISYIEYTKTPLGLLSGVVMKYETLTAQFTALATILNSRLTPLDSKQGIDNVIRPLNGKPNGAVGKPLRLVSTMDSTRSTGLIHGLLFSIYSGNLFISCNFENISSKPRELETLVGKYRGNMLLMDQLQLKQVVLNYLDNPLITQSKKQAAKKIDLSCVKFCLSACTNIDLETSDMIVKKWLNNLGCYNSSKVYSPMLTLTDFGGIFVSLRDELHWKPHALNDSAEIDSDSEEKASLYSDFLVDDDTVFVEKEALKDNEIKIASIEEGLSFPEKYLKVSSFGFPIPGMTTCIVSPDHKILSPNNVVGEIWINNHSLVNEFYQMQKINSFVFNAKLDFAKMTKIVNGFDKHNESAVKLAELNNLIKSLKSSVFLRTKLVGFQFKNKLYVLSSLDDVVLQKKLYQLPTGKHTINKAIVVNEDQLTQDFNENSISSALASFDKSNLTTDDSDSLLSKNSPKPKSNPSLLDSEPANEILETHYLQHISTSLVSMGDNISEVSCFEVPNYKEMHLLVLIFETPILKRSTKISGKVDKQLVPLVNNIYKLLWKFHNVQPFLVAAVPDGCLPRRYCSLEIANSFVEKQFYNGELDIKYLKFQMDSVIEDYIPKLAYKDDKNELSLFNSNLSSERNLSLKNAIVEEITNNRLYQNGDTDLGVFEQILKKDLSSKANIDERYGIDMSKQFSNILSLLEYRIKHQPNELAFSDGFVNSNKKSNSNNYHKAVTWKGFSTMIGSYMKKISESKTPLKRGDYVIILCDNSTEYATIVLTCMYFGFSIIPMISLSNTNKSVENACEYLVSVVRAFKVKRIFVDFKNHALLEDTNTLTGKYLKKSKLKLRLCKITLFSKSRIKPSYSIDQFKNKIIGKGSSNKSSTLVFLNENDSLWKINTTFTMDQLLQLSLVYKDSFSLNYSHRNLSVVDHTQHIGFIKSCILGILLGTSTIFYALNDIKNDSKDFFQDLMRLNLNEVYLNRDLFAFILIKTYGKQIKNVFQNIPHIVLTYFTRPNHRDLLRLLEKYGYESGCDVKKVSFVYGNKFNPFISCRNEDPIALKLELDSLRNGVIKEVYGDKKDEQKAIISVFDVGTIPNGHLRIINPETLQPTYLTEIGEIVVSSKLNVQSYSCLNIKSNKLYTEEFFDEQLKVEIEGESFIRTGDLGFLKPYLIEDKQENIIFSLGDIQNTIEHNGLHFVSDLENCVLETNYSIISKTMCVKVGNYSAVLVQLRNSSPSLPGSNETKKGVSINPKLKYNKGNLVPMIAMRLLMRHNFLANMVVFVDYIDPKNRSSTLNKFINNINNDYIFGIYV